MINPQNLQGVTDNGDTTTNDINMTAGDLNITHTASSSIINIESSYASGNAYMTIKGPSGRSGSIQFYEDGDRIWQTSALESTGFSIKEYDSGWNTRLVLEPNGDALVVGGDTATGTNPGISVERAVTGSTNAHGIQDYSVVNLDTGKAYASIDSRTTLSGSNAVDHFYGFQASPVNNNSNTITDFGTYTNAPKSNAGTITNYYGYRLRDIDISGGGTVTNNYGIYAGETLDAGTNNWFLYSAGTTASYLGGNLTINGALKLSGATRTVSTVTHDAYVEIEVDGTLRKFMLGS